MRNGLSDVRNRLHWRRRRRVLFDAVNNTNVVTRFLATDPFPAVFQANFSVFFFRVFVFFSTVSDGKPPLFYRAIRFAALLLFKLLIRAVFRRSPLINSGRSNENRASCGHKKVRHTKITHTGFIINVLVADIGQNLLISVISFVSLRRSTIN